MLEIEAPSCIKLRSCVSTMIREQNVILKIAIEVIPVILLKFFRPIPNILTSTAMFAFGVKFRLYNFQSSSYQQYQDLHQKWYQFVRTS